MYAPDATDLFTKYMYITVHVYICLVQTFFLEGGGRRRSGEGGVYRYVLLIQKGWLSASAGVSRS